MIVGLLGMSKAGKDEIGSTFINEGFVRHAFGDAVKEEYSRITGYPLEEMFNERKEFHRPGIISLGETKRMENEYYWIDLIKKNIYKDIFADKDVIITDIRRVPELIFMKALKDSYPAGQVVLLEVIRPLSNGGVFDSDVETSHAIVYAHYHNLVDSIVYNVSDTYNLDIMVQRMVQELKTENVNK